jgi:hypothetical protein
MSFIPDELLTRGVAEIIVEAELRAKLNAPQTSPQTRV